MQDVLNLMLLLAVVGVPVVLVFAKFANPW